MIFLIRYIGALFYDAIIILGLLFIFTGFMVLLNHGQAIQPATLWYQFTLFSVALFYYYSSLKIGGQTLGMKAWRFQMVSLTQKGLSSQQILGRILYFIPAILIAPFCLKGSYILQNRWTKTSFIIH